MQKHAPYYTILYHNTTQRTNYTTHHTTPHHPILHSTAHYSTLQHRTEEQGRAQGRVGQGSKVRNGTVRYGTVQYSTVQYSTVQNRTEQYNITVQYNSKNNSIHGSQRNLIQLTLRFPGPTTAPPTTKP